MKPWAWMLLLAMATPMVRADEAALRAEIKQLHTAIKEQTKLIEIMRQEANARRETELKLKARNIELAEKLRKAAKDIDALKAMLKTTQTKAAVDSAEAQKKIQQAEIRAEQAQQAAPLNDRHLLNIQKDADGKLQKIATKPYAMKFTHGTRQTHTIQWFAKRPGPDAPWQIDAAIQTQFTGQAYKKTKALEFQIDGKGLSMPIAQYDSVFRRSSGRNAKRIDDETLELKVTSEQLHALTSAKKVEGKLGPNRFILGPELATALAAFEFRLKRNTPEPSKP